MSPNTIMILIGISSVIAVAYLLNRHAINKFGYSFVSGLSLAFSIGGAWLAYGAAYFHFGSHLGYATILTWIFAAMCVASIAVLIRVNYVETNLTYAVCGSLIQIPLLMVGGNLILPLLGIALFIKMCSGSTSSGTSNQSSEAFQTKARQERAWATAHQEREWANNSNNMQNYNGVHQTNERYFANKNR